MAAIARRALRSVSSSSRSSDDSGGGDVDARTDAPLNVAFLHPDLGLGGAERLVVDAMQALIDKGHDVNMFTSHYNPKRCFQETKSSRFRVTVYGDFLPRHLMSAFHIVFANLRSAYLATMVALRHPRPDLYVCDQVSMCHLILRILQPRAKILFYCHYPDQLLAARTSLLKRLYRPLFDLVEELTTGLADVIVCNSKFSRGVFRSTFRMLRGVSPGILHPCVDLSAIDSSGPPSCYSHDHIVFLSINRFERKKNIALAVQALAVLRKTLPEDTFKRVHLVVAGGYDPRVKENVEYFEHLTELANAQGLLGEEESVSFVKSFTDAEKVRMLQMCAAVLYTPDREHFGIVPLECMAASRPVIAVASGGPLETVVHEKTGFLCEQTPESFAAAMERVVKDKDMVLRMGKAARKHVETHFSRKSFATKLEALSQFTVGASVTDTVLATVKGLDLPMAASKRVPARKCGRVSLCLITLVLAALLAVAVFVGARFAFRGAVWLMSPVGS